MRIRALAHGFDRGFTLVEVAVAGSLFMMLIAAALGAWPPVDAALSAETERGDMMQRLRASFDALQRDLAAAGAGGATGRGAGTLMTVAPAVFPGQLGLRGADPPGTFKRTVITVITAAPLPAVSTTIAQAMPARSGVVRVDAGPGCPAFSSTCGLSVDDDVVIGDGVGSFDLFTVVDVTPPLVHLRHNTADGPTVYPAGSSLIPVICRTYYLRAGTTARPPQLVRYDGGSGPDAPVTDHVVSLSFEYWGEPEPPRMRRPLSDASGPWTTYGPMPPAADTSVVPYVAGSSCLFAANGSALATPMLPPLGGPSSALVPLTVGELTDGPWCPDAASPNRYDADLFRIRSIGVSVRVESALPSLRGPAGLLFTRAGTATAGDRNAPDIELRVRVTPPNLVGLR